MGLASSGLHSNGFSLVRKVLVEPEQYDLSSVPAGLDVELGQELLRPTRIYVKAALELIQAADVHALAHITGGGLPGNLPRVLPGHLAARITRDSWTIHGIFRLIQAAAGIDEAEMLKTFNLGVGMVAAVPPDKLSAATDVASRHQIPSWPIGQVVERERDGKPFVLIPASRS